MPEVEKKCMLTGNTNICVQRVVAIETQAGKGIIRKCRQSQQRKTEPERGHELVGHLSEIYSRCCSFSKPRLHEYYSRTVTGKTCQAFGLFLLMLIYRPRNNGTALYSEGKHFIHSEHQTLLWCFESEVCTCLSVCKCACV